MKANQIIRRPLVTEKSTLLREEGTNVIAFEVDPKANKIEVKNAVEALFKVKVAEVRVHVGVEQRVAQEPGEQPLARDQPVESVVVHRDRRSLTHVVLVAARRLDVGVEMVERTARVAGPVGMAP